MVVLHLIVSCRELWLCSSLQLIMPVKKCVMVLQYLTVSCRKLWLCSSLQLIMPVTKCVIVVLHLIVSCWELWLCLSLQLIMLVIKCVATVLYLSFLQRTMTMFIFATYNYDSKKTTKNNNGVMIVPHLIVSCRKLWLYVRLCN